MALTTRTISTITTMTGSARIPPRLTGDRHRPQRLAPRPVGRRPFRVEAAAPRRRRAARRRPAKQLLGQPCLADARLPLAQHDAGPSAAGRLAEEGDERGELCLPTHGNGYGLRVPGLVISPFAKAGYVDHQTLSFDAYTKAEDDFLGGQVWTLS